jgi:hypothetical protein
MAKPETVIGWHRKGFRMFWAWKFVGGNLEDRPSEGSAQTHSEVKS